MQIVFILPLIIHLSSFSHIHIHILYIPIIHYHVFQTYILTIVFYLFHFIAAAAPQDIADTFEGNFKEQNGLNSNWLPVNSAQVCNLNKTIV